jgi:hypothetical protein
LSSNRPDHRLLGRWRYPYTRNTGTPICSFITSLNTTRGIFPRTPA